MAKYHCGGIVTGPILAHIETGQIIPRELVERMSLMDPPAFYRAPDVNISVVQQNVAEITKRAIAKFTKEE